MTALASRRRHRTVGAFLVGLLGLTLLPALGWVAADALRTSTEGRDALAGVPALTQLPPTPTALLAGLDDQGRVATLTVFALAPPVDGVAKGGTIVVVPAGGDTYLPDGQRGRVAEAYQEGGLDSLRSSVEGLLGITFDVAAALPADRIAVVLPVAPIELNLDRAVIADRPTAGGEPTEVFGAGPVLLDQAGVGQLLTAWSVTESETLRMPRLDSFWRAVAARVGSGLIVPGRTTGSGAASAGGPTDGGDELGAFLQRILAGPLLVHTLSAELVTGSDENPAGLDLIHLDTAEVTVVFATVAFSAVSPPNPTISIYVRSPLGDPAATREAVGRLILAGANVVLVTENPEAAVTARTLVEYTDDNDQQEAEAFGAKLGTFTSQRSQLRIDGVDAIVTLGRSFLDEIAGTTASPTTPSTADPTASTTG